jgi:hypothetical protein
MANTIDFASASGTVVGGAAASLSSLAPTRSVRWRIVSKSGFVEREEFSEQRASAAVGEQGACLCEHAFIFRRAAVGHDLRDRGDRPSRRDAASAGTETGSMNLHDAEQGRQPSATNIFERALRSTARTSASAPAMLLRPRLDQMAL